jgi:ATP-dependent DNA helicase RecG
VDLIFQGLLRYGRPEPDYSSSDNTTVKVILSSTQADIPFLKLIIEEEARSSSPISLDSLIVLAHLRSDRRIDLVTAAKAIQKPESATRPILERLLEAGLIESQGIKKSRTYILSSNSYRQLGQSVGYILQAGFDRLQQEQMVLKYVQKNNQITRKDAIKLCRLSPDQATYLLQSLVEEQKLILNSKGRGSFYTLF